MGNIFSDNIHVYWLYVRKIYIWLSNKVFCNIHIGDTLNYLNLRCNTAKLLWVVIYVVCYGCFSPDLVVMNICRQRLIKVDRPLWQRSLANEKAVVCRQGAMRWRLDIPARSVDCTIYTTGIGTHLFTVSSPLGRIQHCTLCCSCSHSLQFSFLVPSGTHHCWVGRDSMK